MEFIPIKTRIMQPPKDDLYPLLDEYLTDVEENDVVLISSKVLAIHQGRCIRRSGGEKRQMRRTWGSDATSDGYRIQWRLPLR